MSTNNGVQSEEGKSFLARVEAKCRPPKRSRSNSEETTSSAQTPPKPRDSTAALPAEILLVVFLYFTGSNPEEPPRPTDPREFYSKFYRLQWVCSRWRNVIKAYSRLWSLIDLTRPAEMVTSILSHSSSTALDVVCSPNGETEIESAVRELLPQMHRVSTFGAVVSQKQYAQLLPLLRAEAPVVRSMFISCLSHIHEALDVFSGKAPMLRSLTLTGITPKSNSAVWGSVDQLHISDIVLPIEGLSEMLSRCQNLKHIVLDAVCYKNWNLSTAATWMADIELPNLAAIELRNMSCPVLNHLLAYIRAPDCLDWTINYAPRHSFDISQVPLVLDAFSSRIKAATAQEGGVAELQVDCDSMRCAFDDCAFTFKLSPDRDSISLWDSMLRAFLSGLEKRRLVQVTFNYIARCKRSVEAMLPNTGVQVVKWPSGTT